MIGCGAECDAASGSTTDRVRGCEYTLRGGTERMRWLYETQGERRIGRESRPTSRDTVVVVWDKAARRALSVSVAPSLSRFGHPLHRQANIDRTRAHQCKGCRVRCRVRCL